jgi:hypothetical protein
MFSLLAFYIASAAFRSFRIKNFQSGLLLLGAFIVILGQSPLGTYLSASLPSVRNWLLLVPSSAAFRGIAIGSSIAALVLAIKIWLSISIITKK